MITKSTSSGDTAVAERHTDEKAQRITDAIAAFSEPGEQFAVFTRLQMLRGSQLDILERVLAQYGNIIDPTQLVEEFLASTNSSEIDHNFAMLKMAMALNRTDLQFHAICELPVEVKESGLSHKFPIRPEHIALVIRASAGADEWEDSLYEYALTHVDRIKKVAAAMASLRSEGVTVSPEILDEYMVHPPVFFNGVL